MARNGTQQKFVETMEAALRDHKAGRIDLARRGYQEALRMQPRHADALHLLGVALRQSGDAAGGLGYIDRAIAIKPGAAVYHSNRAAICQDLDDLAGARASLKTALDLDPEFGDAWRRLAAVEVADDNLEGALAILRRRLAAEPGNLSLVEAVARVLVDLKRFREALPYYRQVRDGRPDDHRALREVVVCELALKEYHDALDSLDLALGRFPDDVEFLNFLGATLYHLGLFEEARTALSAVPADKVTAGVLITDSLVDMALGRFDVAKEKLGPVHEKDPANDSVAWNMALINLGLGELEEGWKTYDRRLVVESVGIRVTKLDLPFWDGTPAPDAHLVLWSEQGVGDSIRMTSILPEVLARVGKVTVATDARLMGLIARAVPGVRTVDLNAVTAAGYDMQLAIGSLPTIFRRRLSDFDIPPRFLAPDRARRLTYARIARRLGQAPVVGLCWRSRNRAGVRNKYYLDLPDLAPIVALPGFSFVNAQYNCEMDELEAFYDRTGLMLHSLPDLDQRQDIDGSMALIDCFDLVITANTVVGDIAGGLGRPCWRFGGIQDGFLLGQDGPPWNPTTRFYPITGTTTPQDLVPHIIDDMKRFRDGWDPARQRIRQIIAEEEAAAAGSAGGPAGAAAG